MSTKKKKKRKKKQHRFFWFVIKLQIVLMLVVLAGFGYYYFGGYADQIQQMRREAVQEVSASDDSTFIPSQTCSVFDKDGGETRKRSMSNTRIFQRILSQRLSVLRTRSFTSITVWI